MIARARDREAVEFRESGVEYAGAAGFSAWREFDRDKLPAALLRLAEVVSQWPVAPLTLRLSLPAALHAEFEAAFDAGLVEVECVAEDAEGNEVLREPAPKVRALDGDFLVNVWLKADPNLAVSLKIRADARRLVAKGVSPSVCTVPLRAVG